MVTAIIIFISAVIFLQVGILVFCYVHRRDPLLVLPREQRAHVLMELLRVRNALGSIELLSKTVLGKGYGKLNLSQMEFVHQISVFSDEATHVLDALVETGTALFPDVPVTGGEDEDAGKHPFLQQLRDEQEREQKQQLA